MAALILTEGERAVLKTLVALEAADSDGAWSWFYGDIGKALVAVNREATDADPICRNLRKRKLLTGEGSGKWAQYYPTDKGREAVKESC